MRFSLLIAAFIAAAALAAGCPRGGSGPSAPPETTTAYSAEVGLRVTYRPADYSSISNYASSEFPFQLTGKDYTLGIKRLANVGILLKKDPQADFFKFFAQQVRFDLIDVGKLTPLKPETNEEFTAQGKPGLRQVLHFSIPKEMENLPSFVPQEPGKEVWIYYHHFYFPPDYYFFVAISKQALAQPQLDSIVSLINTAQFQAQPLPGGK